MCSSVSKKTVKSPYYTEKKEPVPSWFPSGLLILTNIPVVKQTFFLAHLGVFLRIQL